MARIIHTGLYTNLASYVINHGCIGQCSDGRGENNSKNAKYWKFISVKRGEDDEVLLEVKDGYDPYFRVCSAFDGRTDQEVRDWVANYLKGTVKCEMTDDPSLGKWERWNTNEGCYFGAQVNEAYLIYEVLKGRSKAKSKYSNATLEKVVGIAITPEIRAKRAAIAQVKAEAEAQVKKIQEEAEAKIKELNAA